MRHAISRWLYATVAQAVWAPANSTDLDVYGDLRARLDGSDHHRDHGGGGGRADADAATMAAPGAIPLVGALVGALLGARRRLRLLRQLSRQRAEIAGQLEELLAEVGARLDRVRTCRVGVVSLPQHPVAGLDLLPRLLWFVDILCGSFRARCTQPDSRPRYRRVHRSKVLCLGF